MSQEIGVASFLRIAIGQEPHRKLGIVGPPGWEDLVDVCNVIAFLRGQGSEHRKWWIENRLKEILGGAADSAVPRRGDAAAAPRVVSTPGGSCGKRSLVRISDVSWLCRFVGYWTDEGCLMAARPPVIQAFADDYRSKDLNPHGRYPTGFWV